jgi:hypothetical protein
MVAHICRILATWEAEVGGSWSEAQILSEKQTGDMAQTESTYLASVRS